MQATQAEEVVKGAPLGFGLPYNYALVSAAILAVACTWLVWHCAGKEQA